MPPESLQVELTLSQSIWWVDSESTPHLVDAMSVEHRIAVLRVLRAGRWRGICLLAVQETEVRARPEGAVSRAARDLLSGGGDLHDAQSGWRALPWFNGSV